MDNDRRTFLQNAALASSALAVPKMAAGQDVATGFRRIAVEETFSLPEVLDALRDLVRNDPDRDPGLAAPPEEPTEQMLTLFDLGAGRIAAMDAARIDKEVISLWSPGVQAFSPQLGTELARLANDRLSAAIDEYPDRFAGLATIATQDPERAAQEMERAVSGLGLNGVLINSHTRSEHLDNPKYWPILEAAQALDTPIYLHPRTPPVQMHDALSEYGMNAALWGFAIEASTHVVRMIMSGVFDQFPRLRIVLGHLGEGLPFWLDRLDSVSMRPGMPVLQRLPSEYFLDHITITTSAMFWDPVLLFCLSVVGPDKIMFAIDSPFAPSLRATDWLDAAPISDRDRRMIYQENAERVFSL